MAIIKTDKTGFSSSISKGMNADKCIKSRKGIFSALSEHFSLQAHWLQRHISQCPRCQKRLAAVSRVNLALSIIKSQPHNLDLLMSANTRTISMLRHSLREAPKAQKLKTIVPEPKLAFRLMHCLQPSMNLAACALVMCLMKFGLFSSMENIQKTSEKAYKNYFVTNIGEEMTSEIFPGDIS